MRNTLKILGFILALAGQLVFSSGLAVADNNLSLSNIYISRVSAINGREFVELRNVGEDLTVGKLVLSKGASREQILEIDNFIFRGGSYLLLSQSNPSDGHFSQDSISSRAILQIQIDGLLIRFCAAGKACPVGQSHVGFNLDNKTVAVSEREFSDSQSGGFRKISLDDPLAKASFGGLIRSPSDSSNTQNSNGPEQPENPGGSAGADSGDEGSGSSSNSGDKEPGSGSLGEEPKVDDSGNSDSQELAGDCRGIIFNEVYVGKNSWIEILNSSSRSVNLKTCRLQFGKKGQIIPLVDNLLEAGKLFVVDVPDAVKISKTKGEIFLLNIDESEVEYLQYDNLKSGASLARFENPWKLTFSPTRGEGNNFVEFPPCPDGYTRSAATKKCQKIKIDKPIDIENMPSCKEGYYRDPQTNRCRKQVQMVATKTCPAGYFLNAETGRCRKIETIANRSIDKAPCKDGYYRHPETGRCRKIDEEKSPEPCKDGYERNPETGRCRKVAKNQSASDKLPDQFNQASQPEFTGWWVIVLVAVIGLSLIVWEFRVPIGKILKPKK